MHYFPEPFDHFRVFVVSVFVNCCFLKSLEVQNWVSTDHQLKLFRFECVKELTFANLMEAEVKFLEEFLDMLIQQEVNIEINILLLVTLVNPYVITTGFQFDQLLFTPARFIFINEF